MDPARSLFYVEVVQDYLIFLEGYQDEAQKEAVLLALIGLTPNYVPHMIRELSTFLVLYS